MKPCIWLNPQSAGWTLTECEYWLLPYTIQWVWEKPFIGCGNPFHVFNFLVKEYVSAHKRNFFFLSLIICLFTLQLAERPPLFPLLPVPPSRQQSKLLVLSTLAQVDNECYKDTVCFTLDSNASVRCQPGTLSFCFLLSLTTRQQEYFMISSTHLLPVFIWLPFLQINIIPTQ